MQHGRNAVIRRSRAFWG